MTSGQHISYKISDFLRISKEEFTGRLRNEDNQIRTWDNEYEHLQEVLHTLERDGRIIFEYGIPSFNLVIDVLILLEGKIFVLEYKDGDSANHYASEALNQCRNYALRLKYFHNTSNDKWVIPILVEMNAPNEDFDSGRNDDIFVWNTLKCNRSNLINAIREVNKTLPYEGDNSWETAWEKGIYKATPTIIKAACDMWERNNVRGLDSGESDKDTRLAAEDYIISIIRQSKEQKKKSIVFVTGVPGAGMVMLAMVLTSVGLPVEGIALVAGVDRIFDMGRTTVNITGDSACAIIVSKLEAKKAAR